MNAVKSLLNVFNFNKSNYTTLPPNSNQIHPLASKFNVASEDIKATIYETSENSKETASSLLKEAKPGVWFANGESGILDDDVIDGWYIDEDNTSHENFVVIKLGQKSLLSGFLVDTTYLVNHFNSTLTVLGATRDAHSDSASSFHSDWTEIVADHQLTSDDKQYLKLNKFNSTPFTHLKLILNPHGGIARFKVFGDIIVPDYETLDHTTLDLASVFSGSSVVDCSNGKFSSPNNLLLAGRGQVMGDGWETARSRTPGNVEFATVKLGHPGVIERIEIDTHQYKGNPPQKARVLATYSQNQVPNLDSDDWDEIIPLSKCVAHKNHVFKAEVTDRVYTHLRLQIYPDGGVKRFRAFGVAEPPQAADTELNAAYKQSTGPTRRTRSTRAAPYSTGKQRGRGARKSVVSSGGH